MIRVDTAINRTRRDLALGTLVKAALCAAACAAVLMVRPDAARVVALLLVGSVWIALSVSSARGSRLAADLPSLVAAGRFDEAEQHLEQAMRRFSLFRGPKLQALHHLAVLRHAQRRWQESAALCRALLGRHLRALGRLSTPSRLILADSLLEMDDLRGAYETILVLYQQRLTLGNVLTLLLVQLEYSMRVGAWEHMADQVMTKVQLAELMPARDAARAQAMLALAALRTGRRDLADWLRARVELLADVQRLATDHPALWELWRNSA